MVTITVLALIAIGLALTASPVVYQTTEKLMGAMVVAIMAFVVIAVVLATDAASWGDFATSFTSPEVPVDPDKGLTIALLLGALAFAGAGGANNLVQSNYIRDKGMGMGQRIPHIVSPITGQEEADAAIGYTFTVNDENMRRWRGWWSVANKEQFITFFVIGVTSLIVLSVLTYSTVPRRRRSSARASTSSRPRATRSRTRSRRGSAPRSGSAARSRCSPPTSASSTTRRACAPTS